MPKLPSPSMAERRVQLCDEIASITTMKRGNVNEFYYNQKLKDGTVKKRGPFYNVTVKGKNGKTISKSVPKKDVEKVRREVENYHRFRELTNEYIDVCEILASPMLDDEDSKSNRR